MSSPQVGDVLTTVEQLDALPNDATIRPTRRRGRATEKVGEKTWYIAGIDMPRGTHELLKLEPEWQVIWLPPPPPITEVTWETTVEEFVDAENDGVGAFLYHPHHDSLAVLVGERVRVTVERIGDDDA